MQGLSFAVELESQFNTIHLYMHALYTKQFIKEQYVLFALLYPNSNMGLQKKWYLPSILE